MEVCGSKMSSLFLFKKVNACSVYAAANFNDLLELYELVQMNTVKKLPAS